MGYNREEKEQSNLNETKEELIIIGLEQRIGALVSQYEKQLAVFRAEATQTVTSLQDEVTALNAEIEKLRNASKEE